MISTIMSKATADTATPDPKFPSDVILLHGGSPPPLDWEKGLQAVIAGKAGYTPSIEALEEANTVGKTCIFLGELEHSLLGNMEYGKWFLRISYLDANQLQRNYLGD